MRNRIETRDLTDFHERLLAGTLEESKKSLVVTTPEVDESPSGEEWHAVLDIIKEIGPDPFRVEVEFRHRMPPREKWEARRGKVSYLQYTIQRAIESVVRPEVMEQFRQSKEKNRILLENLEVPTLVTRTTKEFIEDETVKPLEPLLTIGTSQFPLITTCSSTEVFSWRGTGKTNFMIALANCLASGKPWLYFTPVVGPLVVLLIEGEMPEAALQQRMREQKAGHDNLHFACVDFQPGKTIPSLFDLRGMQMVENKIAEVKAQVVIFDSISSLFGFETNEEKNWTPVNAWFAKLRNTGLAVFYAHHAGKSGEQRGHSKSQDALDVSIKLERPKGIDNTTLVADLHYEKLRNVVPDAKDIRIFLERPEGSLGAASLWRHEFIGDYIRNKIIKALNQSMKLDKIARMLDVPLELVEKYKTERDAKIQDFPKVSRGALFS